MDITELTDSEIDFVLAVLATARNAGQTVKVAIDGGLKVKRGGSVWSPPLGYLIDGNGDRI